MHLRHYIQEWNIRARIELPTFPLPDGPQHERSPSIAKTGRCRSPLPPRQALPTVEAILTHLLFEAGCSKTAPHSPEWSQGLFDSPESSRTNDDEWMIYRRSQDQTCPAQTTARRMALCTLPGNLPTLSQERERPTRQVPHPTPYCA